MEIYLFFIREQWLADALSNYEIPFESVREDGPSFLKLSKAVDKISADSAQEKTSLSWPEEDWLQFLNPYCIKRNNRGKPRSESPFSRNGRIRMLNIPQNQMCTAFQKCPFQTEEKTLGLSFEMHIQAGDTIGADPGGKVTFDAEKMYTNVTLSLHQVWQKVFFFRFQNALFEPGEKKAGQSI
ncbi:hypothetical protein CHS0354_026664 [Potamilus streckersoni]|uniref:Uncharacterized protein n=1 Tax=Potamilus streckersoni TaxID=2493646 RepID=A0AAE0S7Z2_9BIVA|nr:hypothetical protein CHS0354_026664 [Potamilus streckersoni]